MWNNNGRGGTTVVVERDQFAILPPDDDDVLEGDIVWPETFETRALIQTPRGEQTPAPARGRIPAVTWG